MNQPTITRAGAYLRCALVVLPIFLGPIALCLNENRPVTWGAVLSGAIAAMLAWRGWLDQSNTISKAQDTPPTTAPDAPTNADDEVVAQGKDNDFGRTWNAQTQPPDNPPSGGSSITPPPPAQVVVRSDAPPDAAPYVP